METAAYLIGYFLMVFVLVGIGHFFYQKKMNKTLTAQLSLKQISVIIPYRNEISNLPNLVNSLKISSKLPLEIIFVNDHSEDSGPLWLSEHLSLPNCVFLNLPEHSFGKKEALLMGVEHSKGDMLLTLDADVIFESDYFQNLERLSDADLWILPVILSASTKRNLWQELDLHILNAINVGLYGFFRPIMASGANLLIKKSAFLEAGNYGSHRDISSGDDMFLLRDFRELGKDIRLVSHRNWAVYTQSTNGFFSFLHQRVRWLSKTHRVKDTLATTLAYFQILLSFLFYFLLVFNFIQGEIKYSLILFFGKTIIDMIFYAPYFFRFHRFSAWIIFPLYQIWFPFYNLLLLFAIPFSKPLWKGRAVKV